MEVIAVKGKGKSIKEIASTLKNVRGVKHSELTIGTTGKALE
jgi:metal-responsive CopG/Arc/MetJ family transcriptional regulator